MMHCWEDGPDHSTCMLEAGHIEWYQDHVFTPDDEIRVVFIDPSDQPLP